MELGLSLQANYTVSSPLLSHERRSSNRYSIDTLALPETANANCGPSCIHSCIISHESNLTNSMTGITEAERKKFLVFMCIMVLSGSFYAFVAKLCYQSLPNISGNYNGVTNLIYAYYWVAWLLVFSSFLVCLITLFRGCRSDVQWRRLKEEPKAFRSVFIAGINI